MLGNRFRHRIDIEHKVSSQDAVSGAVTVTWEKLKTGEPADALTGPGKEYMGANAMQSDTDARFTVHWFSGLTQKMRILWDGRVYNIKTFTTDRTARRYYFIEATEGVNDGE